ncbi:GD25358 [Drosophila simulans]|uniref:GD25358 n=1 Tax=Drosophila simulans TaxID=7240 RepID=B4QD34_DROSI|nr:GD25358 [Drosophila simulans]
MVLGCLPCCNHNGYQQIGNTGPRFGVRHLQCILVFFGLAVAYSLRVNLSVAIVAMTDRNASNPDFPEFDWNESTKSYLLSSFFWGYVVTQIPGGYLSAIYGAKYMLFYGWAPAEERGRLVGYTYSGSQFGTVVMLSVSGYIASSSLGWPSTFYIPGCVGIVWSFVWLYLCSSTPAQHPTITPNERRFIESSGQTRRPSDAGREEQPRPPTPWWRIFTSIPFLVLVLAHCANNWGFWTLLTEIPTFMKNVLGMDIKNNGPLSALPYFAMILLTCVFIWLSDTLKQRGTVIPLGFSRKFFNTLGMWLPMLALIGLGYITEGEANVRLAIGLLTAAVATNSATYLGFHVNHIDLSPNYAGTLMGITNCAANFMSILAPLIVGLIVWDETNPAQWRIVFFFTAFVYFIGNLLFMLFGRTRVQPWNSRPTTRTPSPGGGGEREEGTEDRGPLIGA